MTSRLHAFDALQNFRDYGDYAGAAGRRVAAGRLFRSGHHADVSDADLAQLETLGVTTVVDLRRPSERRRQPSRRPANFTGQVIEAQVDDAGDAPHITFLKTADLTEESGHRFMVETYRRLPFDAAHVDLFSRYFRALADDTGPVLIHCAAGKDRTGVLAALTHLVLDVPHDDLMADYLLTNTAVDLEARAPEMARILETWTGRRASHGAVVAFLGVAPAFLDSALEAINHEHGSAEAYLRERLSVDSAMRDRIIDRLCR
jgi:protein-tyrosine phosphatase